MKKFGILVSALMLVFLVACSSDSEKDSKDESGEKVAVDKGIVNVEVTLPASFFEGEDIDKAIENAKNEGVTDVTKNSDGSLTYKMPKSKHKEMMADMADNLISYADELKIDEDFQSIQDVKYNKSFSKFTLIVDKEAFENSFDGFAALGLAMSGMYYQVFDGAEPNKVKVEVDYKDHATGEVFDSVIYPDALEE
ncbi:hypothetical protein JSQ81_04825 [Sporosarcina sp. Marseille-Q4063]|uniref:hypothetical protein n=1 Tax=Sporosarcina sp. Marseille-Q4063 TaxID=2810514 RepID=UPI001BB01E9B|nr:hypothetical protein [Sporosarcina sp. Marseille-Q4063]QUW22904.1 hypothetical protein JSQ81_04825 [Sporosarcina sp. Marseille-Q4063]